MRQLLLVLCVLAASLTRALSIVHTASIAERAAASLSVGAVHVEPHFLSGTLLSAARLEAAEIAEQRGTPAAIGQGVDTAVRASDAVNLVNISPLPPGLQAVMTAIDELCDDLSRASDRMLIEEKEMTLLRYEIGGHYVRHLDCDVGGEMGGRKRSISVLAYLTDDDWSDEQDGGSLLMKRL